MRKSRQPPPSTAGQLTLLSLALTAALASMALTTAQAQTITSGNSQTSTYSWSTGDLTVNSGGSIIVSSGVAIIASASSGTLSNSGTISGGNTGIVNSGTIGMLSNSGTISGGYTGIYNNTGTIGMLSNSGTISGGNTGIYSTGTIGTLSNSGTISGRYAGIYNIGTIGPLSNSGTISGGNTGIYNNIGTIGTLSNSGLITGSTGAIYNDVSGALVQITNLGTIAGNIYNGSSNDLTINGGTGSTFGTLTGYGGTIGTITNTASNIIFSSGNQLLNDNINVGTNTVSNLAGTLQVNNQLSITGNYVQSAAATLKIGVGDSAVTSSGTTSDSGYGRLTVSGSATIAAGSTVALAKLNTYNFAQGQRYVVVVANTSGTNYHAGSLIYTLSGFNLTGASVVDSGNTDLVLTVGSATAASGTSGTASVANSATTPNAVAALTGLFNYSGTNASLLNVFNSAAALTSSAEATKAGAQLSPTAVTSGVVQASAAATQTVSTVTTSHLDSLRTAQADGNSGVATGEHSYDVGVWGQVFDGHANQSERDNVSGYSANYNGLLLGADAQLTEQVRAGGLFSYAKTSMSNTGDNSGTSASVNSYGLSAYGSYTGEPWYVNVLAGVVKQQYSTTRDVSYTGFSGVANGSFNGLQYTTAVQAGYPLNVEQWLPGVTVTPLAGLSYSTLRQDGYSETGGSGAGLSINAANTTSLKSELAVKAETSFDTSYGKLQPLVQVGWHHEYHDSRMQSTASFADDTTGTTSFATQSAKPVSDTGALSLGVTLLESKNLKVAARYTVEAGSGYSGQTADLQLRYQF